MHIKDDGMAMFWYFSYPCRKFISDFSAMLFQSSTPSSQNMKFIKKWPFWSSLTTKFQWTQKLFWPFIRKILMWTFKVILCTVNILSVQKTTFLVACKIYIQIVNVNTVQITSPKYHFKVPVQSTSPKYLSKVPVQSTSQKFYFWQYL